MDIPGLESLIRAHPVVSGVLGVYVVCATACLGYGLLERRKFNKLKTRFRDEKKFLDEHLYLLRVPEIKDAYIECRKIFGED